MTGPAPLPNVAGTARVTVSGVSPEGEIWNTGFWLAGTTTVVDQPTADATLVAIHAAMLPFQSTLATMLQSTASIRQWKLEVFNSTGPASNTSELDITPVPGSGAGQLPLQTAMCMNLRSSTPGRRARGRMFLPAYGLQLGGVEFKSTDLDNIGADLKSSFDDLNSGSGPISGVTVVVVSKTGATTHEIDRITTDGRPDIQRRRANRQAAVFHKVFPLA